MSREANIDLDKIIEAMQRINEPMTAEALKPILDEMLIQELPEAGEKEMVDFVEELRRGGLDTEGKLRHVYVRYIEVCRKFTKVSMMREIVEFCKRRNLL